MPKKLSPSSLQQVALERISRDINWFADRYEEFDLGADLLSRIFEQLKSLGHLDNRHFRLVITHRLNRLDLSNFYRNDWRFVYTDIVLQLVQLKRPNLIQVDLCNMLQLSDVFRDAILPRLHNLQILNLRSSSCGDRELHIVAENCPNLKELDVSLNDRVTNASIEFFCRAEWKHLQVVDVMHTRIDETGVQQLIQHVPHLSVLRWRNTVSVLARICHERSPTAEVPSFGLRLLMADRTYVPLTLIGAVYSCLNAVQVKLDDSCQLHPDDLRQLEHLRSLEELHIVLSRSERYLHFEMDGMDRLLSIHGRTLQHLTLGRFEHVDLENIGRHCRHLTSLVLEGNHSYRWTEEKHLAAMESLARVQITVCDPDPRHEDQVQPRDVPPWCLVAIMSSPRLEKLKITACHTLDDAIFNSSGPFARLHSLELESCPNFTATSLWNILDNSDFLCCLKIYRCRSINDSNIADITTSIRIHHWDLQLDYYGDEDT